MGSRKDSAPCTKSDVEQGTKAQSSKSRGRIHDLCRLVAMWGFGQAHNLSKR